MPQIQINDVDDGSQYDLTVPGMPHVGDVLLVHDPNNTSIRLVLRVTRVDGEVYQGDRVSTPAAKIITAEAV